jgi:hypothetical protein
MDPKLLADALTTALAPAMPYLVAGGQEAVRRAGKKIGEEGLDFAKKLWEKVGPKVKGSPQAEGAAQDVAAAPAEPDARAALRLQLRKILEADPELAAELARMVDAAGPKTTYQAAIHGSGAIAQGPGAVAAGQGGVAVGGSVQGNLLVGGERARTDRGPDTDE